MLLIQTFPFMFSLHYKRFSDAYSLQQRKLFHAIKVNWWGKCILGKRAMMFFCLNGNFPVNTPFEFFFFHEFWTNTSKEFRESRGNFANKQEHWPFKRCSSFLFIAKYLSYQYFTFLMLLVVRSEYHLTGGQQMSSESCSC